MSTATTLLRERFDLEPSAEGPLVPKERLLELANALRMIGFRYLILITAVHHPPVPEKRNGEEVVAPAKPGRIVNVYRVRHLGNGEVLAFRCEVEEGMPVPSLSSVWAGADWQEREAFDLVGALYEGHPDLRRIMLPEDWEGHPLRKTYAIDTPHRPWR